MNDLKNSKLKKRPKIDAPAIREVELEDLPTIYSLGEMLFTPEKWPSLYRTWDEYELVELFASDGEFCLVAEIKDRIVGFILGTLIEKRRSAWSYGWVIWFGVDPAFKRSGVGTRLLNRLTERFIESGARMMIVDTDADNHEGLSFLKKQGFGDEEKHVYLSRNLTNHPEYLRRKAKAQQKKRMNQKRKALVAGAVGINYDDSFDGHKNKR